MNKEEKRTVTRKNKVKGTTDVGISNNYKYVQGFQRKGQNG